MVSKNGRPSRRSVLKATGAAFGGIVVTTGSAAAEDLCLRDDTSVYEDCPPTSLPGPIVSAGSQAFAHMGCTHQGTQYYYVADEEEAGYVQEFYLEPC